MSETDFEAEGLLDGLDGEQREARLRLLAELADDGVSLEELRRAVEEERLALLPVERVLGGGGAALHARRDRREGGAPRELLERQWRSLGLALQPDDARRLHRAATSRRRSGSRPCATAACPRRGSSRYRAVLGMTMSQLAAANRTLIVETFMSRATTSTTSRSASPASRRPSRR